MAANTTCNPWKLAQLDLSDRRRFGDEQWRRQRSKGARSFRGQKILKPGHPDALFSSKKLTTFFSRGPQNTKASNAADTMTDFEKVDRVHRSSADTCLFWLPSGVYERSF